MTEVIPFQPNTALSADDQARVLTYRQASKAERTVDEYKANWRIFETYCALKHYQPLPATPDTVESFIAFLADTNLSVNTIQMRLAAIGYIHRIAGYASPTQDVTVKETMKGIRHTVGTGVNKKDPLRIEDLRKACSGFEEDERGLRNRAMLLVGYFGAFRRSELVAIAAKNVRFQEDQTAIIIPKSKTDQAKKGRTKHLPILEQEFSDVCPTRALRRWMEKAGIGSGPVFRPIDRWGNTHERFMTGKEVERLVKAAAMLAGLDPELLSGHSLRAGFVTDATFADATDTEIMEQTHHTSRDTVDEYRHTHGKAAISATQKIVNALLTKREPGN